MAEVVRPHGLRGEVLVRSHTDNPHRLTQGSVVILNEMSVRIQGARPSRDMVVLKFEGVDSRDESDKLRGAKMFVSRHDLGNAPDGGWWEADLVGCTVRSPMGEEIGEIVRVQQSDLQDVWIAHDGLREIMIPATASIIRSVAIEERLIVAELPDGLR